MRTIEECLLRLERGLGDAEDLERLAHFARRSAYFLGKLPGYDTGPLSSPNLYSLVHAITDIASGFVPSEIARLALAKMAEFAPIAYCAFYLCERDTNGMRLLASLTDPTGSCQAPFEDLFLLETAEFLQPALHERRPLLLKHGAPGADISQERFFQRSGAQVGLLLPVLVHNQVTGLVMVLNSQETRPLSPHEVVVLRLLSNQAGASIENAQLFQDAQRRTLALEALRQASLALTASLEIENVLNAILESTHHLLHDLHDAHIFLYEDQKVQFGAARFSYGHASTPFAIPRENGLTYTVARTGEMIIVEDIHSHPLYQNAPPDWRGSIIGIPLKIGERVVGVMTVSRHQSGIFPDHEVRALRLLADQAAVAIENARLHTLISQQALTDSLTGLPNRRHFDRKIREELIRSSRYGHQFCVVIMDLNHFKQINDTYGHPFGDLVLQAFAGTVRRSLHNTDFIARYGGDEFALILPETNRNGVSAMIQRVRHLTHQIHEELPNSETFRLDLSAGYAVYPDDADTIESLVMKADQALYARKNDAEAPAGE